MVDLPARNVARAALAATRRYGPLRMVALGDSNGQYALSWCRNIARLSGGKIRLVNNACIAGETSAQIAIRFSRDAVPYSPDIVAMQIGTNDAASSGAILPQLTSMIKKARALPSNPYVFVLATVPHYQNISAGLTTRNNIASLVATTFASDPKVIFCDTYTGLLDPTNPAVVPNTYFGDVHFTRRGAHRCAEIVLATPAVSTLLANVVTSPQPSANDSTRQVVPNPNFDTGTESGGVASGWVTSNSGTPSTFSTGTDPAITGKYQRISMPSGNTFTELKTRTSTLSATGIGGRVAWVSYKMRVVSRPTTGVPAVTFGANAGLAKDAAGYWFGDAQTGYSVNSQLPALADLEDGTWYYIYNEFIADEAPLLSSSVFAATNSTGDQPLVCDFAEFDWGLIDPYQTVREGLNASYSDSSGTPGAATINKSSGRSAIAAAASSVVITSNKVSASSVVVPSLESGDATATAIRVSAVANGSFTVTANAAATAATIFRWSVIN